MLRNGRGGETGDGKREIQRVDWNEHKLLSLRIALNSFTGPHFSRN